MMNIFELVEVGPNDDVKSWAFRIVHYALLAGSIGFVVLIAIGFMTALLIIYVIRLRRDIMRLSKQVQALLQRSR